MIIEATGFELERTPWVAQAACAGCDAELWFPTRGGGNTGINEAKAVCAACPVRDECLTYAIRWGIDHGIWGGLSTPERIRRGRRDAGRPKRLAAAHGTTTSYARGCRCQDCRNANQAAAEGRRSKL